MKLQTLLENVGQVWVVLIDVNEGQFFDDDVFSSLEIFASEAAAVECIFNHIDKSLTGDEEEAEDQLQEFEKLKKRTKTVKSALELLENNPLLRHLDGVVTAKKMVVN